MIHSVSYEVEFAVLVPNSIIGFDEKVFVSGNVPILGNWKLNSAVQLSKMETNNEQKSLWSCVITFANHLKREIHYRFFIGKWLMLGRNTTKNRLIVRNWETFKSPRTLDLFDVSSLVEDTEDTYEATDKQEIPHYGINEGDSSTHTGWLVGQSEIHLRLHSNPITIWKHKNQCNAYRINLHPVILCEDDEDNIESHNFCTDIELCSLNDTSSGERLKSDGCIYNADDYISARIQTFTPELLAYEIDISSDKGNVYYGQVRILPVVSSDEEKPDNREMLRKVPILRLSDNKPIGYINIDVLIITSLPTDPDNISLLLANSRFWRKGRRTLHVGHRGLGANRNQNQSLFNISKPAVPWENTIASFEAAQKAGVDMIEFDVQLTRDNVPLVFHDFQIPVMIGQQASETNELVKSETITVAIKDLTYEQLANFRRVVMRENLQVPEMNNRNVFFPSLSEVFTEMEPNLGFNIEIKYAMQYKNGEFELPNYFERNLIIDRILECINKHAGKRFVLLSSFDPDCCLLMHKKQNRYPVIFLSQGDECRTMWPVYHDVRARAVDLAIRFAASERFLGISFPANEIFQNPKCVQYAKSLDLVLFSWEVTTNVEECLDKLKEMNIDGVICDEIHYNENKATDAGCIFVTEELEDNEMMRLLFRQRMRKRFHNLESVLSK